MIFRAFVAACRLAGAASALHEDFRFVRHGGHRRLSSWQQVDARSYTPEYSVFQNT